MNKYSIVVAVYNSQDIIARTVDTKIPDLLILKLDKDAVILE